MWHTHLWASIQKDMIGQHTITERQTNGKRITEQPCRRPPGIAVTMAHTVTNIPNMQSATASTLKHGT